MIFCMLPVHVIHIAVLAVYIENDTVTLWFLQLVALTCMDVLNLPAFSTPYPVGGIHHVCCSELFPVHAAGGYCAGVPTQRRPERISS